MRDDYCEEDNSDVELDIEQITEEVPEDFQNNQKYYKKKTVENFKIEGNKNEMMVNQDTDNQKIIAFAIELICNRNYPWVKFMAFSKQMSKAVFIGELFKRKVANIYSVNSLTTHVSNVIYTPKNRNDENQGPFKIVKKSTLLTIKLFRNEPNHDELNGYGYQKPIQISLVSKRDPRDYVNYVLTQNKQPKKKAVMNQAREWNDKRNLKKHQQKKDEQRFKDYNRKEKFRTENQNQKNHYQNQSHYQKQAYQQPKEEYQKKDPKESPDYYYQKVEKQYYPQKRFNYHPQEYQKVEEECEYQKKK